jgi:hypothetical protein
MDLLADLEPYIKNVLSYTQLARDQSKKERKELAERVVGFLKVFLDVGF